eukprot:01530.XXX_2081_1498_1 [CDS] Oithona nana genome sequencing.
MLKIDVGMDVLIIGARGYIESLVSQLVGPQGKVTVVGKSKPRIDELRTLMRQIAPERNITYHHVNNYEISGMLNTFPSTREFHAIFYAYHIQRFPDYLQYLLKEGGSLEAPVIPAGREKGNLEVYVAANPRLKKPAEKRMITDFTISDIKKTHL